MNQQIEFISKNGEIVVKNRPKIYQMSQRSFQFLQRNRKHLTYVLTLFFILFAVLTLSFDNLFELVKHTFLSLEVKLQDWILLGKTGFIEQAFKWLSDTNEITKI